MEKKLHRSQNDKIIAGICGGIAEYFEVDSTVVRLLFVLITALGGSGLVVYLVLWLIMPYPGQQEPILNEQRVKEFAAEVKEKAEEVGATIKKEIPEFKRTGKGAGLFGWILIILGIVFLANNFLPYWMRHQLYNYWPLLLVVLGIAMIARGAQGQDKRQ